MLQSKGKISLHISNTYLPREFDLKNPLINWTIWVNDKIGHGKKISVFENRFPYFLFLNKSKRFYQN